MTLQNTMNKINAEMEADDELTAYDMAFRHGLDKARRVASNLAERHGPGSLKWYRVSKILGRMTEADAPTC